MNPYSMPELLSSQTKEEALAEFCKQKGYFSTHDVKHWGDGHYLESADRRVREWVRETWQYEKGLTTKKPKYKIKALDKDEILFRGLWKKGQQHLAWYSFVEK